MPLAACVALRGHRMGGKGGVGPPRWSRAACSSSSTCTKLGLHEHSHMQQRKQRRLHCMLTNPARAGAAHARMRRCSWAEYEVWNVSDRCARNMCAHLMHRLKLFSYVLTCLWAVGMACASERRSVTSTCWCQPCVCLISVSTEV